ncbi:MAG TPA: PAS domain-containing protein [Terriglobales bacterium]
MWNASPNSQKGIFALVLGLLVGSGIASYVMADRYAARQELVVHTYQVVSLIHDTAAKLEAAENAARGYVLVGDETLLIDFDVAQGVLPERLNRLQTLTSDNPDQQKRIQQLRPLITERLNLLQQSIQFQKAGQSSLDQQVELTRRGIAIDDQIRPLLTGMEDKESRLLQSRSAGSNRAQGRFTAILMLAFLLASMVLVSIFLMMIAEVARRTRAEASARENEEKFRLLVTGIQDYAIIRLDLDGRITTWNRGAEGLFGYTALEILGKPLTDLFQACDRDTPLNHLRVALRDGHIQDECQQLRRDGSIFWATADLTLLRTEDGQPRGYAMITRDITERRRQRQEIEQRDAQLNGFFSNAPVGLAIIGKDLRFHRINGPFSKLNGLPPEVNTGLHVRDVASNLAGEFEPLIGQVLATGTPVLNHEIRGETPANPGVQSCWLKSFFPIIKEGDFVTQVGAIVQDVTPLKRAENAIRWLSGRLLQMRDDERRRLARDLHDSLGQILSAIKMNLSYLARDTSLLDERGRNAVTESRELIDGCIKEVRTLSHLLHPPMLDEVGLLPAIRWFVTGFSQRSGIDVKLDLPATLQRFPIELEIAIFRVVQEGLTNVHRHSGSPTAIVSLGVEDSQVHLKVIDHGRGIPSQALAARQEDSSIGIGLPGMRERTRQLGGMMEIDSSGEGTAIHVTLPLGEAA